MNLNAYDDIKVKIDKKRTWIDVRKRALFTREIKFRKYYSLLKRFNIKTNNYDYFVAVYDTPIENKEHKYVKKDDYGRVKILLNSIWLDTDLIYLENNCNIDIKPVDYDDDGEVYLLCI